MTHTQRKHRQRTVAWGDTPNHPTIRVHRPQTDADTQRLITLWHRIPERQRPSRLIYLVRGYKAPR